MMKGLFRHLLPLLLIAICAAPAAAQNVIELEALVQQEREVVDETGATRRVLVDASRVVPGETVLYTTVYRNVGQVRADHLVINNPIPEHTVFVAGSASEERAMVEYSVDGGFSFDLPANLVVAEADGRVRPATPRDYTNVRWTLEDALAPGETGQVGYRVQLK